MLTACHTKNGSQGGDSRSKQINAFFERYINDAEPNAVETPTPPKTDTIVATKPKVAKPKPAQPKQAIVAKAEPVVVEPETIEEPAVVAEPEPEIVEVEPEPVIVEPEPVVVVAPDTVVIVEPESEPIVVTEPDTVAAVAPVVFVPDTIAEIAPDTIVPREGPVNPLKAGAGTSFNPDSCEAGVEYIERPAKKLPVVALRTNLLYDALVVPNIGLEVALPMHFTIAFDWIATWIKSDNKHLYWQGYGGYLTLRYYFGKAANEYPFIGHHVGIYGDLLTYDVEFGGQGYQAWKPGFGGGVEYGYSLPVGHDLCIDFNIGVGYQGGQYEVYQPANDGTGHYVWQATRKRRWFGPTKAEISLKWMISPVEKKKKGGQS